MLTIRSDKKNNHRRHPDTKCEEQPPKPRPGRSNAPPDPGPDCVCRHSNRISEYYNVSYEEWLAVDDERIWRADP